MKKTVLVPVFLFLFLLIFSFLCFNEDSMDEMGVLNASGRNYLVEYRLLYNEITYFEDSGKSSVPEKNIKWDRIFVIAATAGMGIYMFTEHRRKRNGQ